MVYTSILKMNKWKNGCEHLQLFGTILKMYLIAVGMVSQY